MLGDLAQGFMMALRLDTFALMAVGLFAGMLVGALPGFTTLMAMAILLPISFFLDPIVGIPFLLGIYKGGIFGGSIPKTYIPAVEKGITEAAEKGYLAGYPVVDFKVVLYDGSYHDVDSSELAFKLAGRKAFRAAMEQAAQPLWLRALDAFGSCASVASAAPAHSLARWRERCDAELRAVEPLLPD